MNASADVAAMAQHMIQTDDRGAHAASPLAAWLLRELVHDATHRGADRPAPADVDALTRSDHPGVTIETAAWASDAVGHTGLGALAERARDRAPDFLPHRMSLDAWTARVTDGTYSAFPLSLDVDPMMSFMHPDLVDAGPTFLAALAASTTAPWLQPPVVTSDPELMRAWGVNTVLRQRDSCGVVNDRHLGTVGVTLSVARTGLVCISVIADPDVAADRVLAAAHRIAQRVVAGEQIFLRCPPESASSWWSTSDVADVDPFGNPVNTALMPAWAAHADHDMYHSGLNYHDTFATTIRERLGLPHHDFRARQAAAVWFTGSGLVARSVTAVLSAAMFPDVLAAVLAVRETEREPLWCDTEPAAVTIRHTHPFAAVACSVSEHPGSPWHAMTVWSAWVTEAIEAC